MAQWLISIESARIHDGVETRYFTNSFQDDAVWWSPTGKARGTHFTPKWGDIPAKHWRIHPRPKAVVFCCRGKSFHQIA
jgi:hypothetical protein